ncbi:hypothetical protein RUND412_011496 [Rhizina undulata]
MPHTPRSSMGTRTGLGKGLGKGPVRRGMGKGVGVARGRHKRLPKDTIHGITNGDIRRLARRGGVKRISGQIYEDVRGALVDHLKSILKDCIIFLDHAERKTVTVTDVIFALKRIGRPIYGFDKNTAPKKSKPRKVRP